MGAQCRRDDLGIPIGRIAAGFVHRWRRVVDHCVLRVAKFNFVGAYTANGIEKLRHVFQRAVARAGLQTRQQLGGNDAGALHFLANALAGVVEL